MERYVTQVQFSNLTGLNKSAVFKLTRNELKDATNQDGRINRDHPAAMVYINQSGYKIPPPPPSFIISMPPDIPALMNNTVPPTDYLAGTEIEGLGDMTLREIANKYGTVAMLVDWLNARKKIVDISEKEIKNFKTRGELIPRDFVEQHIIQQFERTNMNLLNDAPKTIAAELMSLHKSNASLEEAEMCVERILSTHIRAGKEQVKRMIKQA